MAEVKDELFEVVPHLLNMPSNRIWVDYDEDADVLYKVFRSRSMLMRVKWRIISSITIKAKILLGLP